LIAFSLSLVLIQVTAGRILDVLSKEIQPSSSPTIITITIVTILEVEFEFVVEVEVVGVSHETHRGRILFHPYRTKRLLQVLVYV
jgi:hypothetical protein